MRSDVYNIDCMEYMKTLPGKEKLIEIPYTDFDNIEKILKKKFKL